jgi:hypothetical protein
MSKSSSFANQLLLHLLNNQALPDIGDASGLPAAATEGNLYIRLCTDAVVASKTQLGTQASYTGYVPGGVAVPRSVVGFTVAADIGTNAAKVTFPISSGNDQTIKYFEVWKDNASALIADRVYVGTLSLDLAIIATVTPEFAIGALAIQEL